MKYDKICKKTIKNPGIVIGIILTFSFFYIPVHGQSIDSLNGKLKQASTASDSITLINKIGQLYLRTQLAESEKISLQYFDQAIAIADRIKDKKKLSNAITWKGVYYVTSDRKKADSIVSSALNIAKSVNDTPDQVFALTRLGLLNTMNKPDTALLEFTEALQLATTIKDSNSMASCWTQLGHYYDNRGDYARAMQNYLYSLKVTEAQGNTITVGYLLLGLGVDNQQLRNYELAFEYYSKAEKVFKEIHAERFIASTILNIGTVYELKKDYKNALKSIEEAVALFKKNKDDVSLVSGYRALGEIYTEMDDYAKACIYLEQSLQMVDKIHDDNVKCNILNELASVYLQQKQYNKALATLKNMVEISTGIKNEFNLMMAYQQTSQAYSAINDYKNAYYYQGLYTMINDSLFNIEKTKQIAEMQSKYETEKKNKEILLLNKDKEVMRAKISKKNIGLIGISAGGGLIILLIVLLLSRRNLLMQNVYEKELNIQQQQVALTILKAQEEERQKIAKDMHDSLGAYLSSLKINMEVLQPAIVEDKKTVYKNILTALDKVTKEIRAIAKNLVSDTLQQYGLEIAVEELVEFINQSGKIKILYNTVGLKKRFAPELETGVFRIVQELLNNSLKHASAKTIKLDIVETNDIVSIVFVDDGVGFDKEDMKNESKGIGLKSMEARAKILKGSFNFDSKPGTGSLFKIEIPYAFA